MYFYVLLRLINAAAAVRDMRQRCVVIDKVSGRLLLRVRRCNVEGVVSSNLFFCAHLTICFFHITCTFLLYCKMPTQISITSYIINNKLIKVG